MDAIVAVDARWGIGRDGDLLFRISADLRRFKAPTMGHTVVMGRRTLQSLPGAWPAGPPESGAVPAGDLAPKGAEAFCEVQQMLDAAGEDAFVIGGAAGVSSAAARLSEAVCDPDRRRRWSGRVLPEPAPELWRITEQSPWQEEQGLRYRYVTYERKEERDEV